MRTIRTYSELKKLSSFEDRFEYLKLDGKVGAETFGFERYLNQHFYRSRAWKSIRDQVIIRDDGNDLAMDGYQIGGKIIIHHLNPITKEDVENMSEYMLDPEYLICCSLNTHNAIHFGDVSLLPKLPRERRPNDTCPWKN